jgi:hypothetical protein
VYDLYENIQDLKGTFSKELLSSTIKSLHIKKKFAESSAWQNDSCIRETWISVH